MVTVRTVAPGASSRAWAACPAKCVSTVSVCESSALVSAMSPGRRSCGSTLWQMTAVRGRPRERPGPSATPASIAR